MTKRELIQALEADTSIPDDMPMCKWDPLSQYYVEITEFELSEGCDYYDNKDFIQHDQNICLL